MKGNWSDLRAEAVEDDWVDPGSFHELRIARFWCALAAGLVPLLQGCPDSRCSVANCRAALDGCRLQANLGSFCFKTFGSANLADAGVDVNAYCAKQCQDEGIGAGIACLADHSQMCVDAYADGGLPGLNVARDQVAAICFSSDGGGTDPTCVLSCFDTQKTCESACPTSSPKACFDCASSCAETSDRCVNQCP